MELDAYSKQMLKNYDIDNYHATEGSKYLYLCSEIKKIFAKLGAELHINRSHKLKLKFIDIVQVFVENDESFLRYVESKVVNPSGGQRQLSVKDFKMLCRLYAIKIVEEAWR